jgi:hypothetical protein
MALPIEWSLRQPRSDCRSVLIPTPMLSSHRGKEYGLQCTSNVKAHVEGQEIDNQWFVDDRVSHDEKPECRGSLDL